MLRERGRDDALVFAGGIIPDEDIAVLEAAGVARVFTPGTALDEIVGWLTQALDERQTRMAGSDLTPGQ